MNAVDYAIQYKFPEVALAMVTHPQRANEVLLLKSEKHPCVTLALIASMPKVFESVQDSCIEKANCKKDSKSFYVRIFYKLKKKLIFCCRLSTAFRACSAQDCTLRSTNKQEKLWQCPSRYLCLH